MREPEEFQNLILSAFKRVAGRYQDDGHSLTAVEWAPPVSISEDEKEYRITTEVSPRRHEAGDQGGPAHRHPSQGGSACAVR
ncbi:MAG: hypothetical protein EOP86_07195 [Verrucomicrobiaceae bacterium]|nr:MAG: hypothetical protein EOP86_07195 [Verrucomicrobiaceae bacterium]